MEVSGSTRITKAQAERIGESNPKQAIYRDNVLNYLAARNVGSTSLSRLFASGYKHALSEGERVQGPNKKISLTEARKLANDLVDDFFVLRGKAPPSAGSTLPASSAVVGALTGSINALGTFWESGDNGVNVTVSALPGAHSLAEALAAAVQNPDTPWTHAESPLLLSTISGQDAVAAFASESKDALNNFDSTKGEEIDAFAAALPAAFAGISDIRSATGKDLGGLYLVGKTADNYVLVTVQPYADG